MADILPPVPWDMPPTSFEWTDWYAKLRKQINDASTDHNQLTNIQGGTAGEYYHLTQAQSTALATAENTTNKNAVSGYAGLNSVSRTTKGVDTTDDVIVDVSTKGLVLKDAAGTPHYWRVTISTLGVLTTTDLGTTKP